MSWRLKPDDEEGEFGDKQAKETEQKFKFITN